MLGGLQGDNPDTSIQLKRPLLSLAFGDSPGRLPLTNDDRCPEIPQAHRYSCLWLVGCSKGRQVEEAVVAFSSPKIPQRTSWHPIPRNAFTTNILICITTSFCSLLTFR